MIWPMMYHRVYHGDCDWELDPIWFDSLQQALLTAALADPPDPVVAVDVTGVIYEVYNVEPEDVPQLLDALDERNHGLRA